MTARDATGRKAATGAIGWLGAGMVALCVAGGAAAAVAVLYARADAQAVAAAAPAPLPVAVLRLEMQDGHRVQERFVGRIEPARESRIGFERGGLVKTVTVREGDRVRAGQTLARLDDAALAVARQRLQAARAVAVADAGLARATLERRSRLTDQGHASPQALDEARFAVEAQAARIAELDAQLAQVALDIEKSALRAPFDAVVAERMIDEGAVVAAGAPLLRLQEAGRPRARVGAPFDVARPLQTGATHALQTPAGPVDATLAAVTPDMDRATRTVGLIYDLPADAPVAMGDIVRLTLDRRAPGRGAWVPLTALTEGLRGMWALSVLQDGPAGPVVVRAPAQALHVADGRAFVTGAFADGALAVARGVDRIAPGQRVTAVETSAAAGDGVQP